MQILSMICLVIFTLFSTLAVAESPFEKALKTGVYEYPENSFGNIDKTVFNSSLFEKHKGENLWSRSNVSSSYIEGDMAAFLHTYKSSKKIHTAIYESTLFSYKADLVENNVVIEKRYKSNNQLHSKVKYFKGRDTTPPYSNGKHQAVKTYWPSGKLQSKQYYCSGQPVGFFKYYDESGRFWGVVDWSKSDYESEKNKMGKKLFESDILLFGEVYLNKANGWAHVYTIPSTSLKLKEMPTLGNGEYVSFKETYQRHKLEMEHLYPLNKDNQLILQCPWIDEAMSYANENSLFALVKPKPIEEKHKKQMLRNQYEACVFNPNSDCLSQLAFKQVYKNKARGREIQIAWRVLKSIGKGRYAEQIKQWRIERGVDPSYFSGNEHESLLNEHTAENIQENKSFDQLVVQAKRNQDRQFLVNLLRQPFLVQRLTVDFNTISRMGNYIAGDSETYLMALVAAAQVFAYKGEGEKAKELLTKVEKWMPDPENKQYNFKPAIYLQLTERMNDVRAVMGITYAQLGMHDQAKSALSKVARKNIYNRDRTALVVDSWLMAGLNLCNQKRLEQGREFLDMAVDTAKSVKNRRVLFADTFKKALKACDYHHGESLLLLNSSINSFTHSQKVPNIKMMGRAQLLYTYQNFYKENIPVKKIESIEQRKRESDARHGVNRDWISQHYYLEKLKALYAANDFKAAQSFIDEFEKQLQAGSWHQHSPVLSTQLGMIKAKYGDCKGAMNNFKKAVDYLQLNKMIVRPQLNRKPHQTSLPYIAQGMAHCDASVQEIEALQIDFDYPPLAITLKSNREADKVEVNQALMLAKKGETKRALAILERLQPSDLKITGYVNLAQLEEDARSLAKPYIFQALDDIDRYFGTQNGAKEQRRAIGGFLNALEIYLFEESKVKDQLLKVAEGVGVLSKQKGKHLETGGLLADLKNRQSRREILSEKLKALAMHANRIPQAQFRIKAICHLGYLAEKGQLGDEHDYFVQGSEMAKQYGQAHVIGSPVGACSYWLKKSGRKVEAEALINVMTERFRDAIINPNDPNNWKKFAEGDHLANAAFVHWEYENGELASEFDELMAYYNDSTGLVQAY